MFQVDVHNGEIPLLFNRFREMVGETHWLRRAGAISSDVRGRPYLAEHLLEENAMAFALARCSALAAPDGMIPLAAVNEEAVYPAYRLVTQTLSLVDNAPPERGDRLIRRLRGALKNPDEMRAIQFEWGVATHFARRGHRITWPEMEGNGTFDLLLDDIGPHGLEIECKSASNRKGRKVHKEPAAELNDLVRARLEPIARTLQSGLCVVLTVADRLPKQPEKLGALADVVCRAVFTGTSIEAPEYSVRIADFVLQNYPDFGPPETPELRKAIDEISSTNNREAMILGKRNTGALLFVVQSQENDSYLGYVFDSLDDAARNQLTKTRPGMVLVGLEGISSNGLIEAAKQDQDPKQPPTALRVMVSEFLRSNSIEHVIGAGFLSADELFRRSDSVVSSGGSAYFFPKKESPYWSPAFSGLFTPVP